MSYGEVVLVQEWQVWRVVSRWVTIADRLSQFGVWCCEAWIGEAGMESSGKSSRGLDRHLTAGGARSG